MRLVRLPVNQAWVFAHAELTVPVGGHYIHESREVAVSRANEAGLDVSPTGVVTPRQTGAQSLLQAGIDSGRVVIVEVKP